MFVCRFDVHQIKQTEKNISFQIIFGINYKILTETWDIAN